MQKENQEESDQAEKTSESKPKRRKVYNSNLKKKFKKPIPRTVVPSFFTLMNLFCGFLAIIQVIGGKPEFAAWLIVMAGFFDLLDGFMARLANATSLFGIELDSLSDIVSFGVAPGILLYTFSLNELYFPGILLSALPPLCGAVRLSRFNVEAVDENEDHSYFKGLPIPAQAVMIVAFFLTFRDNLELFDSFKYGVNSVVIPMVVVLSFLMVSTVPFDKIPRINGKLSKKEKRQILWFLGYFIIILLFREYGLITVFAFFIVKGVIGSAITFWKELQEDDDDHTESD
jgi:CDP-diacylglycerol--serine O-phosphatidyltransferase